MRCHNWSRQSYRIGALYDQPPGHREFEKHGHPTNLWWISFIYACYNLAYITLLVNLFLFLNVQLKFHENAAFQLTAAFVSLAPSSVTLLDSLFVVLFGPVIAWLWLWLDQRVLSKLSHSHNMWYSSHHAFPLHLVVRDEKGTEF